MNYEGFTEKICESLKTIIVNNGVIGEVVVREIIKNNNVHLKAVSIVQKSSNATPTIYLEPYYEEYMEGRPVEALASEIFTLYKENVGKLNFQLNHLRNFDNIRDKIAFKVINYDMNRQELENIPHIKVLDLAIVFFIAIACEENHSATALIRKEHLALWKVAKEEIVEIAFENTPNLYPAVISRMEDILAEIIITDIEEDIGSGDSIKEDVNYGEYDYEQLDSYVREEINNITKDNDVELYVLTNKIRINGAATMFYDNVLRDFAREHECDVYIIPSSVHEVILIPDNGTLTKEGINGMIIEVNQNEVSPIEVLSNHVYVYHLEDEEIHM